eukprot:s6015_g2.t1
MTTNLGYLPFQVQHTPTEAALGSKGSVGSIGLRDDSLTTGWLAMLCDEALFLVVFSNSAPCPVAACLQPNEASAQFHMTAVLCYSQWNMRISGMT